MPRPVRPWFRFYVEACADLKLRRQRPEYRWLFVAILAAARQSPVPGHLMVTPTQPMTDADIADFAGMDLRTVRSGLTSLAQVGLIVSSSSSDLGLCSWSSPTFLDRQFESDDVTARTRKHRATSTSTSDRNEVGTFQRRSREQDRNTPETETETETETLTSSVSASVTQGGRLRLLEAAAEIIGRRASERVGVVNPTACAKAVARAVVKDHYQAAYAAITADPSLTPARLADLLEPSTPPEPARPAMTAVPALLAQLPPVDKDLNLSGIADLRKRVPS